MMSHCMFSRTLNKPGKLAGAVLKSRTRNVAYFTAAMFSSMFISAMMAWKGKGELHMMETSIGVVPMMFPRAVVARTFTATGATGTSPKMAAPFACPAR